VTTYGGIELGGTSVVCALGDAPDRLVASERFPTATADVTLSRAIEFVRSAGGEVLAVGIGTFGPVDLDPDSPTFGVIADTPKPGWTGVRVLDRVREALGLPVAIDTDVNAAAVAEWRWGAARGAGIAAYVTVGTGIGAGFVVNGAPWHGRGHPEFGHVPVDRVAGDAFPGVCPFHGDCAEGMASGPAIEARWSQPAAEIGDEHPAWDVEARYLGQALAGLILTVAPHRVVLGGGVMLHPGLHARVRDQVRDRLGGYLRDARSPEAIDELVVAPGLGRESGALGAIELASRLRDAG
jgi:fructokinase